MKCSSIKMKTMLGDVCVKEKTKCNICENFSLLLSNGNYIALVNGVNTYNFLRFSRTSRNTKLHF